MARGWSSGHTPPPDDPIWARDCDWCKHSLAWATKIYRPNGTPPLPQKKHIGDNPRDLAFCSTTCAGWYRRALEGEDVEYTQGMLA